MDLDTTTPTSPFDLPLEIVHLILIHFFKNEVLTFRKPSTHLPFSLAQWKSFTEVAYRGPSINIGESILSILAIDQHIRDLAMPFLARYAAFDLKGRTDISTFLTVMPRIVIRKAQHIIARSSTADL